MRRLRLFLDANVLVDAQLRDLFLRMAEAELIDIRWSDVVLEETGRALQTRLGVAADRVERVVRFMSETFAESTVTDFDSVAARLDLPDTDDRHVLAGAVVGECDVLVTSNIDDFPDAAVEPFDLVVLNPDDALVWLAGLFGRRMTAVVERQIAALSRPPMTTREFLQRLSRRAPRGAAAVGVTIGDAEFTRLFVDIVDAGGDASPQGGVRSLLEAVDAGDPPELAALVDEACALALTGGRASPQALVRTLRQRLADVFNDRDGWGFATARRPLAPNVELVKLVRGGEEPSVSFASQVARGHLFLMEHRGERWVLLELDGEDPALTTNPPVPGPAT